MVNIKSPRPWAKMGYAARGLIYLTIGMLALFSAMGWEGEKTGSRGAILNLKAQPLGELLLVILVVGLFGYIMWRFIQGITDTDNHGHSFKGLAIRSGLIISAISHSVLVYWVIKLLLHETDNGSGKSASSTASEYLNSDIVTVLVALVGVLVVVVGIAHLVKGFRSGFKKYIDFPADKSQWLVPICRFGLISRGVVWCIIGWIILRSVFVAGSSDEKGIDDAFEWLSTAPYGSWLIIIISIGLFAFGVYSFIESLYRRIET
jgi:flagellar biogenesis protein FliO